MPPQNETSVSAPRLPFIDGLRGIAVLAVVCFHAVLWGGIPTEDEGVFYMFDGAIPIELGHIRHFATIGGGGVDLFLAISGFCLFWPLVKNGTSRAEPLRIGSYFQRRIRRICPPYYFAFAGVLLVSFLTYQFEGMSWWPWKPNSFQNAFPWKGTDSIYNVVSHLLLIHGFFSAYISAYEGAYWSLSTEWQFYFLFVPLALIARRFGVMWAVAVPVLFTVLFRMVCTVYFPDFLPSQVGTLFSLSRWVQFGAGMLAAVVVSGSLPTKLGNALKPLRPLRWGYLLISVIIAPLSEYMLSSLSQQPWPLNLDQMMVSPHFRPFIWANAGFALMTVGSNEGGPLRKLLEWRPLVWVGTFSYSLYLTHGMVYMGMALLLSRFVVPRDIRQLIYLALGPVIAIAFSWLFFLCFEKPFLSGTKTRRKTNRTLETVPAATVQDQAIP